MILCNLALVLWFRLLFQIFPKKNLQPRTAQGICLSRKSDDRSNEPAGAINSQEPRLWIVSGLPTIQELSDGGLNQNGECVNFNG
jgi:hypothetical protein